MEIFLQVFRTDYSRYILIPTVQFFRLVETLLFRSCISSESKEWSIRDSLNIAICGQAILDDRIRMRAEV